jgi:hypothetical protein
MLNKMDLTEIYNYKSTKRIRLKSFRNLKSDKNIQKDIDIHMTDSIENVVLKMRYILLRTFIIDRQLFVKRVYTNLDKLSKSKCKTNHSLYQKTMKDKKKLSSIGYDFSNTENVQIKIHSGYRNIAKKCGCSHAYVNKLLNTITKWKYIKGFSEYLEKTELIPFDVIEMRKLYIQSRFYTIRNNSVYSHLGTSIIV